MSRLSYVTMSNRVTSSQLAKIAHGCPWVSQTQPASSSTHSHSFMRLSNLRYRSYTSTRITRSSPAQLLPSRPSLIMSIPSSAASVGLTSTIMFVGAYVAMLLPGIKIPSQQSTQTSTASHAASSGSLLVNAIASGLLSGASLCLIIPEGFNSFSEASSKHLPQWTASLALLSGFTFMLVLDVVSGSWGLDRDQKPDNENARDDEGLGLLNPSDPREQEHSKDREPQLRAAKQTLLGLVIHAAADGIAAGAASLSGSVSLSATISLAILLHKFPVAYSLSIFLRKAGLKDWPLSRSLLTFSLASPLFLLATYFLLGPLVSFDQQLVSLIVLFSGGSVCFAAFLHVLPSTLKGQSNTCQDGSQLPNTKAPGWVTAAIVISSFVPLLMAALLPEA